MIVRDNCSTTEPTVLDKPGGGVIGIHLWDVSLAKFVQYTKVSFGSPTSNPSVDKYRALLLMPYSYGSPTR